MRRTCRPGLHRRAEYTSQHLLQPEDEAVDVHYAGEADPVARVVEVDGIAVRGDDPGAVCGELLAAICFTRWRRSQVRRRILERKCGLRRRAGVPGAHCLLTRT